MGIDNPVKPLFTPITAATFNCGAGADGWVDTDVSAATGTVTDRIWLVGAQCAGTLYAGARAHGGALDNSTPCGTTVTLLTHVDATGHVDLRRNVAGDVAYAFIGYIS